MSDTDRNDELIAMAGALKAEISPERDLWPGISEGIARPRRSRWTPILAQAAAVVLLVGASSSVTYLAVSKDKDPFASASPQLTVEPVAFAQRSALGPKYQQARIDMTSQYELELAKLDEDTRAEVEKNLKVIHGAIDEINKALAGDPENVLLQEFLLNAYQDEFRLMNRIGGLTQQVMSRTDI